MDKNNFLLKGRKALVTGGSRGIGKAIADLMQEAGAKVIRTDTRDLDLGDDNSVRLFLKKMDSFGPLDILVNNAGINKISAIDRINSDDWDRIIKVNLTGAARLTTKVAQIMIARKTKGRILNISSIYGVVSRAGRAAYSASKAGLIGLTRATALDLAPRGILVNALCPGFVLTGLTRSILSAKEIKGLSGQVPLGRFGKEEEIASAALFLCSDMNTYITGQALMADGGFTAR